MIRSILSLPKADGSLAALFTLIAPMVPADSTALPEICDVGWQLLRPGHPDSVAGLLIGFIIALALKGLTDPDCLVLPAPVAPGLEVRLPAPSTSARLGARVESLVSKLALIQTAVASAEVTSPARSDAMEARLLAALSALLASQHQSHHSLLFSPIQSCLSPQVLLVLLTLLLCFPQVVPTRILTMNSATTMTALQPPTCSPPCPSLLSPVPLRTTLWFTASARNIYPSYYFAYRVCPRP